MRRISWFEKAAVRTAFSKLGSIHIWNRWGVSLIVNVVLLKGNMADEREFDEARTARMINLFMTETLGLRKVAA